MPGPLRRLLSLHPFEHCDADGAGGGGGFPDTQFVEKNQQTEYQSLLREEDKALSRSTSAEGLEALDLLLGSTLRS